MLPHHRRIASTPAESAPAMAVGTVGITTASLIAFDHARNEIVQWSGPGEHRFPSQPCFPRKVPVTPLQDNRAVRNSRLAHTDVLSVSCKGVTGAFPATNPNRTQSAPLRSAG